MIDIWRRWSGTYSTYCTYRSNILCVHSTDCFSGGTRQQTHSDCFSLVTEQTYTTALSSIHTPNSICSHGTYNLQRLARTYNPLHYSLDTYNPLRILKQLRPVGGRWNWKGCCFFQVESFGNFVDIPLLVEVDPTVLPISSGGSL
jgi:hypothetical protein